MKRVFERLFALCCIFFLFVAFAACSDDSDAPADPSGDTDADEESAGETETEAAYVWDGRLVDLVNPFIGTAGIGFSVGSALPGHSAPFGMLKVSPDTEKEYGAEQWSHCGGYDYTDIYVKGFTHTHLHGIGVPEYGNILLQPIDGMTAEKTDPNVYRQAFDHEDEEAHAGYYRVKLQDTGIDVELTGSVHSAYHRYTFPSGVDSTVLLDLSAALIDGEVTDSELTVDATAKEAYGWVHNLGDFVGRFDGVDIFFVIRFDTDFGTWGTWKNGVLAESQASTQGTNTGAYFQFPGASVVHATVGISFVSVENARLNLDEELKGKTFDEALQASEEAWEELLGKVQLRGGTHDDQAIYYTAMYHAYQMPSHFTDVNGQYRGFDKEVHEADGFTYYTDFSMWDTYRTLHPWLHTMMPERASDMMKSLLTMADQGGKLPKWPLAIGYTGCMVGTSADVVLADAHMRGVTGFDTGKALTYMLHDAYGNAAIDYHGRGGDDYDENGYRAEDLHGDCVAQTLEYCWDDFAIGQMAQSLGDTDTYQKMEDRRRYYKNIWQDDVQFFVGRDADGTFDPNFDPLEGEDYYVEGNAWQYLWLVPHDVAGLIELFGSTEAMVNKLDTFFVLHEEETALRTPDNPLTMLPPDYYWHGNEPDIHAAYMFLDAGRPDLTQKWARWIMANEYRNEAMGLAGNDDCGTLSAWYTFSSIGLFPLAGSNLLWIGSPLFDEATVELPGGTLTVTAKNASPTHVYVESVKFDGEELTTHTLTQDRIANGGTLEFTMSDEPGAWLMEGGE